MLHVLFSFRGRINRAKFWIFYLVGCFGLSGLCVAVMTLQVHLAKTAPDLAFFDGTRFVWPGALAGKAAAMVLLAVLCLFFYVVLAMIVKRLHDRGKSAWWLAFFYGVPAASFALILWLRDPATSQQQHFIHLAALAVNTVVTWWYLIELLFLPGTRGENRSGPDPRARG